MSFIIYPILSYITTIYKQDPLPAKNAPANMMANSFPTPIILCM